MNAQVKTELLSLQKVAAKGMGFVIPSYQRPYVWSDDDVIKLLDDIKAAFLNNEPQYFIGSALSAIRPEGDDKNLQYELIDGQQRTTTLMLVSLAFKASGVEAPLAEVSLLGKNPRLTFEIRESVQNLLGSNAGLENLSKPGPEAIRKDEYLKHLDANLTVLKQLVCQLKEETDFDLMGFAEYIHSDVIWVNNIVPDKMDLNRLFSSMNTAGIQLEPVDLLKAKLFKKIISGKALYSTIWQACEHTDNYFEKNLRQLFPNADWNRLEYKDLSCFSPENFGVSSEKPSNNAKGKTIKQMINDVAAGDIPDKASFGDLSDTEAEIEDETVYCRSVISFELLLIHALRIFRARKRLLDVEPRIKSGNLMACFECLLDQDETTIKEFVELLWQVRYQFDTWVVKWVEHDDREDPQLRLTTISRSKSGNQYYINRSARELSELVQLQAVRNFTGDRSAQYWICALLGQLVAKPDMKELEVLGVLEQLDNWMSLTTETQKQASFKIAKGEKPHSKSWQLHADYFDEARGTSFEHYWFQKLEYLLWKHGDKENDQKLRRYRITSKNSVEHVHPQNEEYKNNLPSHSLDAFGNLVLLSPGENSSYSNQTVLKKKADFESKPRYDSLKLKEIFKLHSESENRWAEKEIEKHQKHMLNILSEHYQQGDSNG